MTPEERALVLAGLLAPLRNVGLGSEGETPAASFSDEGLGRLAVDGRMFRGLDSGGREASANRVLSDVIGAIERSTSTSMADGRRPAPNPLSLLDLLAGEGPPHPRVEHTPAGGALRPHANEGDACATGPPAIWPALAQTLSESPTFDALVWSLLALEQRYLWYAPWSGKLDLPLPQTARLVAAASLALGRAGGAAEPLRLVSGDLSGIQAYIANVTTGQDWGGAARRLRARSLSLQLLSDIGAHQVLHRLDLPPSSLLMSGGGRFLVIAPATAETADRLATLQSEWEASLLVQFDGEVRLCLAHVDGALDDLTSAGPLLSRLADALAEAKARPLAGALVDAGGWIEERFIAPPAAGACTGCASTLPDDRHARCASCRRDEAAGAKLERARSLAYRSDGGGLIPLLGYSVDLVAPDEHTDAAAYLVARTGLSDAEESFSLPVRAVATHVPPALFEDLAQASEGRAYLGYLKIDVDRLGALFSWGLRRDGARSLDSLPRLMAVGDWLERFFAAGVPRLAREEFPDIYIIFAGGDDLLAVGPWSRTVRFVSAVRDNLEELAGRNPSVTCSGGLAPAKSRFAVAQMVGAAEEQLEGAKDAGRDALMVFDDAVKWGDWPESIRGVELLVAPDTPSSVLRVLSDCARLWQEFARGNTSGARFAPLLHYTRVRNVNPHTQPDLNRWLQGLAGIPSGETARASLNHLTTTVRLATLERSQVADQSERT